MTCRTCIFYGLTDKAIDPWDLDMSSAECSLKIDGRELGKKCPQYRHVNVTLDLAYNTGTFIDCGGDSDT